MEDLDVVILDNNTFLPTETFSGYSSLVWTERFSGMSDFEIDSYDVANQRKKLPLGSFISLLQSKEVMMVETHELDRDENNVMYIKTTGRSVYSFYEQREALGNYYSVGMFDIISIPYDNNYKPYSSMGVQIAWFLYSGIVKSYSFTLSDGSNYFTYPQDLLPVLIAFTDSTDTTTTIRTHKTGTTKLDAITELTNQCDIGIAAVRPPSTWSNIIDFHDSPIMDFDLSSASTTSKIVFSMYKGVDRSATVVFHNENGYLQDLRYFASDRTYYNFVNGYLVKLNDPNHDVQDPNYPNDLIYNASLVQTAFDPDLGITDPIYHDSDNPLLPRNWQRRVGIADLTALIDPDGPAQYDQYYNKNPNSSYSLPFYIKMGQALSKIQKKATRSRLIDAKASPASNYVFGVDYKLGDTVGVIEDYGIVLNMRVIEYTRSVDADGVKSWPTFSNRKLSDL